MQTNPIKYWRNNRNWSNLLGKTGEVVVATQIKTTFPELQNCSPYSFAIVKVDQQKYEFMSEQNIELKKGDKVKLVLRKIGKFSNSSLINYGIKLKKL